MTALVLILAMHAPTFTVSATAYDSCSSGSTMADGRTVHVGAVANNFLPLGTKIRMSRGVPELNGRRDFVVEDRIGSGSQLDIWMPGCSKAIQFGRETVTFRVQEEGEHG
jgi:3D (Asp-Asp-Asp) domain-containing protein